MAASEQHLSVVDSSVIICIRRNPSGHPGTKTLKLQDSRYSERPHYYDALVFGKAKEVTFSSGWQVLLGQRQVVNYMRSSQEKLVPMRYPGEFTFPGGVIEAGETPDEAARREFTEEMHFSVPADAQLRLLSVRQTLPVRNKSNVMFNFVAHEDENPWLRTFDVDKCNALLQQRYAACHADIKTGAFWNRSKEERASLSPEVHKAVWIDIPDAVEMAYLPYINEFQASAFAELGLVKRDPTFLTLVSLLDVETIPSLSVLIHLASSVDAAEARAKAIWLPEGLSPDQTKAAIERAQSKPGPFTAERFAALKVERSALAAAGKQSVPLDTRFYKGGLSCSVVAGVSITICLALLSRRLDVRRLNLKLV